MESRKCKAPRKSPCCKKSLHCQGKGCFCSMSFYSFSSEMFSSRGIIFVYLRAERNKVARLINSSWNNEEKEYAADVFQRSSARIEDIRLQKQKRLFVLFKCSFLKVLHYYSVKAAAGINTMTEISFYFKVTVNPFRLRLSSPFEFSIILSKDSVAPLSSATTV